MHLPFCILESKNPERYSLRVLFEVNICKEKYKRIT